MVQVHAEYDDDEVLRDQLLSPYEDTAEEARRAEQRARAASAKKKTQPAAPEPF